MKETTVIAIVIPSMIVGIILVVLLVGSCDSRSRCIKSSEPVACLKALEGGHEKTKN